MKLSRLLVFLAPLVLLTACGLSDQQKADYASVQRSGVSPGIYDKMLHDDPLSIGDIRSLAHAGVSDGVIIRYIRDHGTVYALNSRDIDWLRKGGVSETVIDFMLRTQVDAGPPVYVGIGVDPFWYGPGPYWGGGYYHGGYYHHWH